MVKEEPSIVHSSIEKESQSIVSRKHLARVLFVLPSVLLAVGWLLHVVRHRLARPTGLVRRANPLRYCGSADDDPAVLLECGC